MKKIITPPVIFFSLLFLVSCGKDFLEEAQPTDAISQETVFASKAGVEEFVAGILRLMRSEYEYSGSFYNSFIVIETNFNNPGLYGLYFARVLKGNDIMLSYNLNSPHISDYYINNRSSESNRANFTWIFCYEIIKQANFLIHGVENSTALSDEDKARFSAQGKALRAFFYFQLAMEFTATYAEDPTAEAPPIYTEPTVEPKPMSTLQEVYEFILEDLDFAVTNLTDYRPDKSYINQQVAYGILARVHQVMGNWPSAELAARNAYGGNVNSALDAAGYTDGFNDMSNLEWIWGSPQTVDQNVEELGVPHAALDYSDSPSPLAYINTDFRDWFSPTDVRNGFEFASVYLSTTLGVLEANRWATTKFTYIPDADHPIIRSPEMILIEAEALYWQGDEDGACNLLTALQLNRHPLEGATCVFGLDLLEQILQERRKELYGEIGVEWFDAKRLRRGIFRTLPSINTLYPNHLCPDDVEFYQYIPQVEIDKNPYIDESVNAYRVSTCIPSIGH